MGPNLNLRPTNADSGRILMETSVPPVIIPIWLTGKFSIYFQIVLPYVYVPVGFDKLMPEGRPSPYKFFPRLGAELSVTIGDPLLMEDIRATLAVLSTDPVDGLHCSKSNGIRKSRDTGDVSGEESVRGWMGKEVIQKATSATSEDVARKQRLDLEMKIRMEITAIVQRGVEALGRKVSGDLLGGSRNDDES